MSASSNTRAADATRRRFISAGWDLIDEIGLLDTMNAISVADVAARAERSERTFWNHFETWNAYVESLVSNIPKRGPMQAATEDDYGPIRAVDEVLVSASRQVMPLLVRAAAEGNWSEVTQTEELKAFRRQLLLSSRADDDNRLTEVLGRDYYGSYLPQLEKIYRQSLLQTRMDPIAPFDLEGFTRILAALSEGLLMQYMADPERITLEFTTDATAAVALSLLHPEEHPESVEDIEARVAAIRAPLEPSDELTLWASECTEVVERRGGDLLWTEVASVTGVSQVELRSSLQRLEVLGALVFGQLFEREQQSHPSMRPEGRDASGSSHTGPAEVPADPREVLLATTNWLCMLVRTARAHRWTAGCLLRERLGPGEDVATIRSLVPLGCQIAEMSGEETRSVHDRMVNTTLAAALSDDSASPAELAYCATEQHPALRSEHLASLGRASSQGLER